MSIGDTDFGVQVGIGVLGMGVAMVIAFFGSVVLARELGAASYGSFYLLMAVVALLDNPVTGWARAVRKRMTQADFPTDEAVGSLALAIACSVPVVAVGALVASPVLTDYAETADAALYLTVLFAAVVTYIGANEVLKGMPEFGAMTWMHALRDLVRVGAQVGLVLFGLGLVGMVTGMVVANLLVAAVVLVALGIRPSLPSRETVADVWAFGKSSIPDGILGTALGRMDILLLGALATSSVAGTYQVTLKMTVPAFFIATVASSGLMGQVSNLRSRGQDVTQEVQNNLDFASLFALPILAGAVTMGDVLVVTIYGSEYALGGLFITWLALFQVLRSQSAIYRAALNGLDKPDLNLRLNVVVFALNLVLGVWLFFVLGPVGIVVATVAAKLVHYLGSFYFVRAELAVNPVSPPLRKQALSAAAMGLLIFAFRETIGFRGWIAVLAVVGAGGVCYLGLLVVISEEIRGTARSILGDV